ncbi:MAG TPA: carbohydrate kinase family protein [Patescibacteria group bacterium]|nr:carbohydrate kinase family protein [Patescibacteria group bacterium]
MLDIISAGDATLDVFLQLNEEDADVKCDIKDEECKLCLDYADKIPVESIVKIPGAGNGSNNAVGSSRLGMQAAMFGILGDDEIGHGILNHWKEEGVDTGLVSFDSKRGTNYSTVLNFRGERTILVFHEKRDYRFPKDMPAAQWIYYTSLGKGSERMHPALLSYVKRTGSKLCFQPGTFQLKLGIQALQPIIAASAITVVNKEEAERIVGNSSRDVSVLLKRLKSMGCGTAVITDGPLGSFAFDGELMLRIGIFEVPVVERTGCGDSYATAFLSALHYGKSLGEAMRWGTANAASVLGAIGPQAGLLTRGGMDKMLKRFADVQPSAM